jgi:hypothetical protein
MHDEAACDCKVTRTRSEYDIDMDDDALVAAWQGETSVRELTRTFNDALIERRLDAADASGAGWDRVPVYEALKTEELSDAESVEVRRELERGGVDPEALEAEFISHQTMYRHLNTCLDASPSNDLTPDERREKARDTVYALQRRTTLVTESTIDTLQAAEITDIGDPDVLVDIQIVCRDCGYATDFETALTGSCNCQ